MPSGTINTTQAERSVVTIGTMHQVHIGDMRHLAIMWHSLSHLSEMLTEPDVSSTTLRLTACMVLIALRASRLSEATSFCSILPNVQFL